MIPNERDMSLFRALVEGEVDESSPQVRELFATHAQLEQEWLEMKDVFDALESAKREKLEVLEQASQLTAVPGADRAEVALRAAMKSSPPASSPVPATSASTARAPERPSEPRRDARAAFWPWLAAAAALIALIALAWQWNSSRRDPARDVLLGDFELTTQTTGDAAAGTLRFEWRGRTSPGARFMLTIEGKQQESDAWREVLKQERIVDDHWTPAPNQTAAWPPLLRWRVVAYAGDLLEAQSDWSRFSLSR